VSRFVHGYSPTETATQRVLPVAVYSKGKCELSCSVTHTHVRTHAHTHALTHARTQASARTRTCNWLCFSHKWTCKL